MSEGHAAEFSKALEDAIRDGELARADLVGEIARLNLSQMAGLSPEILSALGPDGLAELAHRRSEFRQLAPRATVAVENVETDGSNASLARRAPNRWVIAAIAAGLVFTCTIVAENLRPRIDGWRAAGDRPLNTASWPPCERLTPFTDGCIYIIRETGDLSVRQAAALLDMEPVNLAAINTHIKIDPGAPLPTGASIVVWRGTYKLVKGNR